MVVPWRALQLSQFWVSSDGETLLYVDGLPDDSTLPAEGIPTVVYSDGSEAVDRRARVIDLELVARALYPTLERHDLKSVCAQHGLADYAGAAAVSHLFAAVLRDALRLDRELIALLAQLLPESTGELFGRILPYASPSVGETGDSGTVKPVNAPSRASGDLQHTVEEVLGRDGVISQALPGYEFRSGQLEMAESVEGTFHRGGALVAEAGPGTGKTFAYLVPALLYLKEVPAARMIISTRTKQLQEQLFGKDLPFLVAKIAPATSAALLKGRENYICKRRWQLLITELVGSLESDRLVLLAPLARWLLETETGDIEENSAFLSSPSARRLWGRLCDSAQHCVGGVCPYESDCFSIQARRRARKASLVVVNHSLLLGDLVANGQVLGSYSHLIIDEAHALEAAARLAFSSILSQRAVDRLADELAPRRGGRLGWLQRLSMLQGDSGVVAASDRVASLRRRVSELFAELGGTLPKDRRGTLGGLADHGVATSETTTALRELEVSLEVLCERVDEPELIREAEGHLTTARDLRAVAETLNLPASENEVHWYERAGDSISLHVTPLEVGPILSANLYRSLEGIVLTSATISLGEGFQFFSHGVGLDSAYDEVSTCVIGSPFAYEERMKICLPTFLPPLVEDSEGHVVELAWLLTELVNRLDRKTLVLFTSYSLLEAVHERLAGSVDVLAQGVDGSRTNLVDRFQGHRGGILLLGTDSFWEGLDLPGDALELLVITRLPFAVPTDPIQAALSKRYMESGRDSFLDLALPQAVLKLRQGIGRLIRTEQDRGVVLLTDRRITSKGYGGRFRAALPVPIETYEDAGTLIGALGAWYGERV